MNDSYVVGDGGVRFHIVVQPKTDPSAIVDRLPSWLNEHPKEANGDASAVILAILREQGKATARKE
jgi:hypothetical protein